MSLSLPEISITSKQLFGEDVELQVHDQKLYITRKVNGVTEGGVIILDPLPPSATLGAFGNVTAASAVTGEYLLAVNSEDYTEAEMDDLAIQLQAELEAQFPGTTISVTVVAGSLKAQYTIVPSDVNSWDMTAAAASLDTNKKTMLKNAASAAGLTQLASDIENDVVVPSASVLPTLAAQVLPGIVKSVSFDSGTVTIETLGAFKTMKYSVDGGVSWSDITPAASGNSHTLALAGSPNVIRMILLNAGGSKIAQFKSVLIPPPEVAYSFSFDGTICSSAYEATYSLPITSSDWELSTQSHNNQLNNWVNGGDHIRPHFTPANTDTKYGFNTNSGSYGSLKITYAEGRT